MNNLIKFIVDYLCLLLTTLIFGAFFWYYEKTHLFSSVIFAFWLFPSLLLNILFAQRSLTHLFNKPAASQHYTPILKHVIADDPSNITYVFEYSAIFSINNLVSLYCCNSKHGSEMLIGLGYIETIPNGIAGNKKIMQVKITQWYKEYNDFYAKENERDIILKSTIPHIF